MSATSAQASEGSGQVRAAQGTLGTAGLVVVLLVSTLAWAPLLYPGFVQTHSGLGAVYDALGVRSPLSGWMPSYATPGDGPLATWMVALVGQVSGLLGALRLVYALSFILSGAGMYLLARRVWGDWAAVVAATVYVLLPYHLSVVYVRGALAEAVLFALAPFLYLALAGARGWPRWLAATLLTAALVVTNAGLGALTVLMALLTVLLVTRTGGASARAEEEASRQASVKPDVVFCLSAVAAGVVVGALVLLPAGARALANLPGWQDHFVYAFQLFAPGWGFGASVAGWQDGMSFQLGLVAVVLSILALWGAYESHDRTLRRNTLLLLALAGIPVVLTLTVAAPLWRVTPLPALVAYPWQLLCVAAVPLALLAGAGAGVIFPAGHPARFTMFAVVMAAVALASYTYLAPRFIDNADLPDLTHPPLAQLGEDLLLLDVRVDKQAQPGQPLQATLTWQALRQPQADLTTFTHLVDAGGQTRGQKDVRPHNGAKPTNTWLPGEIVRDDITVPIAADAPPGDYRLQVGMYLLSTLQRLHIAGPPGDAVSLGPITVK